MKTSGFFIMDILKEVSSYIEKQELLTKSGPVIVGFSGGADSIALLTILKRLGYDCIALHCNFHLRDKESVRDELFSRTFAKLRQISFEKKDFDTKTYAREKHISIEMAARELRYGWFESMRKKYQAQAICVAHHRDDNIETFLLNLIRGTGLKGLCGIQPKQNFIVRPLLCLSKEDILSWIKKENYSFVTDTTNLSDVYTRNFIRLRIVPLLEKVNPSVKQSISNTMKYLHGVNMLYADTIELLKQDIFSDGKISIKRLLDQPAPETVLYELLKDYGFNSSQITDIFASLKGQPGKFFYSSCYRIVKDRDYLLVSPNEPDTTETFYILNSLDELDRLPVKINYAILKNVPDFTFERKKSIAYFDSGKLKFPIVLRKWKEGDWFVPFGMKGRKKISDYFSNKKYSQLQKEESWLLCSQNDIVWLVGERTDERYRVGPYTKYILKLEFEV